MATFADFEHSEGGDDTSSVTICPEGDFDGDTEDTSARSPLGNYQNGAKPTTDFVAGGSPFPRSVSKRQLAQNRASDYQESAENSRLAQGDAASMAGQRDTGCGNFLVSAPTTTDLGSAMAAQQMPGLLEAETVEAACAGSSGSKNLLLCRRFKDSGDSLRNFTSLPLFIYATSPSTHATSADGVGVAQVAVKAAEEAAAAANIKKNDSHELGRRSTTHSTNTAPNNASKGAGALRATMDCLPLSVGVGNHHPHLMASSNTVNVTVAPPSAVVTAAYPHHHHLNLNHHHLLGSHHLPYGYGLHHAPGTAAASSHHQHHIHSEQTKSLQELQHEVGALLEFRDLVIETFPDLKQKMASISSATSTSTSSSTVGGMGAAGMGGASGVASVNASGSVSGSTVTSGSTLVSRRDWEPGIRGKRKISQKELSHPAAADLTSSSSLTRSRSNSHSGKKEPKSSSAAGSGNAGVVGAAGSGENNGSVVQDSGFSTETSSSKEGHSASSTNGGLTGAIASNRLSCAESDDELLNLLDVIHRKSSRLREEVEHLQNYERQHLRPSALCDGSGSGDADEQADDQTIASGEGAAGLSKSSSSSANTALTPKTFREHVERLNREDIQQLRRERDRLLDKLAEMEAETLTGRIKAAKMSEKVEELINVKRDLEEQLKLAMAQRLELNARVQQLQQNSRGFNSQSDSSSSRTFLSSSATTVLSTASTASSRHNTFQPVVVEQQQQPQSASADAQSAQQLTTFHQSSGSDSKSPAALQLGRLDGIVSNPADRSARCRVTDSKRFAAILLETSVVELQRHLLTLTVKNQVLMQKLDAATKSKCHLVKRLDKSKDDVEDLRFQLEEKSIELEGTKAQLRVLESRLHSYTPSSGAATNSYFHSQNDYETNRSSASTTLMLSRRGGCGLGSDSFQSGELRPTTPAPLIATPNGQMPQPLATQISTPSMKAMTHLPMDDVQHHSSSTESAHENDGQRDAMTTSHIVAKMENGRELRQALMSTSVGGISPFEQQVAAVRNQVQALKKFKGVTTTKPSKIPLAGSKAAAYFAGKPPSGRPSTAGRSPNSANSSASSQSRSPLSRSTGNLLYSKSPNSLKRADSAQSIRKDNSSSFSTNTSRSSTSSSIPLATTPHSSVSKTYGGGGSGSGSSMSNSNNNNSNNNNSSSNNTTLNSPSSRILQNSPLPKPKRESLSTKVRHMDSLSRAHHHQHQHPHNLSNGSNCSDGMPAATANLSPVPGSGVAAGSYFVSSTPKPASISSQLTTSVRKDLQLSSSSFSGSQAPFQRRANANATGNGHAAATRRFSSASVVGARVARQLADNETLQHSNISGSSVAAINSSSSNGGGSGGSGSNGGAASDSDSGKNFSFDKNYGHIKQQKSALHQYFEEELPKEGPSPKQHSGTVIPAMPEKVTLSQYFEKELLEQLPAEERLWQPTEEDEEEEHETDFYTSYASYMSSSDPGSDNILVTIDYGSMDEDDMSLDSLDMLKEDEREIAASKDLLQVPPRFTRLTQIREQQSKETLSASCSSSVLNAGNPFPVHHVRHSKSNVSSVASLLRASSQAHNVDTSGDYGSWQQLSESGDDDARSRHEYRYEDLIQREMMGDEGLVEGRHSFIYGEYNGKGIAKEDDCIRRVHAEDDEVLQDVNYDVALSARWPSDKEKLYYKSVDYLN